MSSRRLDSEERRKAIIAAALPLFARRGFAGTTTKEIADAAGVSEALLFKHFPRKQVLYEAILALGCEGTPGLDELMQLEETTTGLVTLIEMMIEHYFGDVTEVPDEEVRHRMRINSLLEDGEFARLGSAWVRENVLPKFAACLRAAEAAGDLRRTTLAPENAFWFAEHLAAMAATTRLAGPDRNLFRGTEADIRRQATHFILRGIGVEDTIITELYDARNEPARRGAVPSSFDQERI